MKSSISMKSIAKELNVSIVTVSKALNDKEGVSEELKLKIRDLADKMGYRYNMMAKSMRDGLSYNIGVVIPEHFIGDDKSYYFSVFKNLSKIMEKHQYCAILQVLNSEDEEKVVLPKFYYDRKVDGLIVLGQVNRRYIKALQSIEIPTIFLDFYDENTNVDSITVDNYSGAYEMTNYLIKKGHADIAFVGDIYATSSIQDRYLGMCKSLLEHGIRLREDYVICDRDKHGKYIELKFPKEMPTAFVCNCDGVAYNLIIKLKEMGYSVPEDFSVVGFDNDIYATISDPQITTVEVDVEEMAGTAVKSILDKVKKENRRHGRSTIKGRIVLRDSVKDIR
ncbi:MAG TPA: LacI family DNA-binding transcriptional regulator [Ruminiclostridium sp.]|nr:LacI family DNA-binding transcriptional regulator [Ruminiclostridium sp.]